MLSSSIGLEVQPGNVSLCEVDDCSKGFGIDLGKLWRKLVHLVSLP